jgi:uncharacterized membrane protein HdeD (DUF308 family)
VRQSHRHLTLTIESSGLYADAAQADLELRPACAARVRRGKDAVSEHLCRYWSTLIARGLLALGLVLACLLGPPTDLPGLALLFGAYLVADGALSTLSAFGCGVCWGALLLAGVTDCFLGSLLLLCGEKIAPLLGYFVMLWSLTLAALWIVSASELEEGARVRWLFRAAGVVLILLAVVFLSSPASGVAVWRPRLCVFLSLYGSLLTALGVQYRSLRSRERERILG